MNAHTPGPWKIAGQSEAGRYIKVGASNGRTVARVPFSSEAAGMDGTATDAADASLMAAAPDLLAALADLLVWDDGNLPGDLMDAARAAIAKAKGAA